MLKVVRLLQEKVSMTTIDVAAVTSIELVDVTTNYANLDWDNASPTGMYNVRYSDDGGSTWTVISNHLGSSINLFELSSNTTYDVEITSVSYTDVNLKYLVIHLQLYLNVQFHLT